ncbi:MAG: sigma-70 family RNA polymerase sigma factor [Phycisphaerae bacterium]|nr:MAG: sigma-70 family RNA polymerase sigma factor [Planctomycetota bacterium]KAB2947232.1 MAG: sigma-70 family RNA polymerase sigma factor [Phycisphaerae bacterium]MBE7458072.1 sigma-70 family RNA polymerase sigma factor [Planctomycetia bacterium]MCK6464463.1 sigma-70 family RNA polymerase sigma factor [Phycisphaerae bacterium]MCL4717986.1 sigma-70 family RNA polymerase sigma factor [Phycisphaerae bacterium]
MNQGRNTPRSSTDPHGPSGHGREEAPCSILNPRELGDGTSVGRERRVDVRPWATPQKRDELYRLAYRLLWNAADAEDAVQDALVTAEERGGQIADPAKAWSWICRVVVHRCRLTRRVESRRRRGWLRWVVGGLGAAHDQDAAAAGDARRNDAGDDGQGEASAVLRTLLPRLPRRQGEVLVLRHLQGMSFEEIGDVLEMSPATARVQAMNARESMLNLMRAEYPDLAEAQQRDRDRESGERT